MNRRELADVFTHRSTFEPGPEAFFTSADIQLRIEIEVAVRARGGWGPEGMTRIAIALEHRQTVIADRDAAALSDRWNLVFLYDKWLARFNDGMERQCKDAHSPTP